MIRRVLRIMVAAGFYLIAALRSGLGIRVLVTGRAMPKEVRRFRSVRSVGVSYLVAGAAWAVAGTGFLLNNGWMWGGTILAAVMMALVFTTPLFRRRGPEPANVSHE